MHAVARLPDRAPLPPQLLLGFADLSEASIRRGIATIADLLAG
jgi:hypothetical protein